MTLRQYLVLMGVGTLLCWGILGFILLTVDPLTAGITGMIFFYLSLFLALVGTFSVLVFLVRRMFDKNEEVIFRHVRKTFRQSVTIALFVILVLFLQQKQLLTWWNGLLLVIIFIALEGIVFTNRKHNNQDYVR